MSGSAWGAGMADARYARQLLLPEIGEAGQAALADSRVGLIGCGGLGTLAAGYLAGAGVGRLHLADGDRVELSNLHRQLLYTEADIGQPKATALAAALQARNPMVAVHTHPALEGDAAPEWWRECDLILDCSDNFPTRYRINSLCARTRRPLLSAAAIGLGGQLLSLRPGHKAHACYHCVFPDSHGFPEGERCSEAGVLGPSVGLMASLQATQAITILLGRGQFDRIWRWEAADLSLRCSTLAADPACRVCAAS